MPTEQHDQKLSFVGSRWRSLIAHSKPISRFTYHAPKLAQEKRSLAYPPLPCLHFFAIFRPLWLVVSPIFRWNQTVFLAPEVAECLGTDQSGQKRYHATKPRDAKLS